MSRLLSVFVTPAVPGDAASDDPARGPGQERRGRRGAALVRSVGRALLAPPAAVDAAPPTEAGGTARGDLLAVPARGVTVLARAGQAFALGGAIALAENLPLVCVWGAGEAPPPRAPALPAAARLAAKLVQRGHTAWATGRLAMVLVVDQAEAGRALAASDGGAVLVVAVPRGPEVDAVLRTQDVVLVAGADDVALTELAVAELEAAGLSARPVAVPVGARRMLAAAGLSAAPA